MTMTDEEIEDLVEKVAKSVIDEMTKEMPDRSHGETHSVLSIHLQAMVLGDDPLLLLFTAQDPERVCRLIVNAMLMGMALERLGVKTNDFFGTREELRQHAH